jgi:hypothetical protein
MMEEVIFFLRLQIIQMKDDISISQIKYAKELVKKFSLEDCQTNKTQMVTNVNLGVDEGGNPTDIHQYRTIIPVYNTTFKFKSSTSFSAASRP